MPYSPTYETAQAWIGDTDEVGIWNRSLTPSEINQLYNNGTGFAYPFGPAPPPPPAPITLNTSLVAYYSFNIDARDDTGINNGSADTLVSWNTTNYKLGGQAATFSGVLNSRITLANSTYGNDSAFNQNVYTMCGWVNPTSTIADDGLFLISTCANTGYGSCPYGSYSGLCGIQYSAWAYSIQVLAGRNNSFENLYNPGPSLPSVNNYAWTHWCFVQNETTLRIYQNASSVFAYWWVAGGSQLPSGHAAMGYDVESGGYKLKGTMDEVAYWARELNSTEISQVFANGTGAAYPSWLPPVPPPPPTNGSVFVAATQCANMSEIVYIPDIHYFNPNTNTLTQYNISPENESICQYTYLVQVNGTGTVEAKTNLTGATYEWAVNGIVLNSSFQYVLYPNSSGYINVSTVFNYIGANSGPPEWNITWR